MEFFQALEKLQKIQFNITRGKIEQMNYKNNVQSSCNLAPIHLIDPSFFVRIRMAQKKKKEKHSSAIEHLHITQ